MDISLNEHNNLISDLTSKLIADKSHKESIFIETNIKNRLNEMGHFFVDKFHFYQFCDRITRVIEEHAFNSDLISFYLDYKDPDNRGLLIGKLKSNVETISTSNCDRIEMRMNFKFIKE